jgi:hypothetical protein
MSSGHIASKQGGTGPIERRLRELGGVKALVVGAFAEHSADVYTLVDGLAEDKEAILRTSHHCLVDPSKAKGAAKSLLATRLSALQPGTHSQSALLQSRLSFVLLPPAPKLRVCAVGTREGRWHGHMALRASVGTTGWPVVLWESTKIR